MLSAVPPKSLSSSCTACSSGNALALVHSPHALLLCQPRFHLPCRMPFPTPSPHQPLPVPLPPWCTCNPPPITHLLLRDPRSHLPSLTTHPHLFQADEPPPTCFSAICSSSTRRACTACSRLRASYSCCRASAAASTYVAQHGACM